MKQVCTLIFFFCTLGLLNGTASAFTSPWGTKMSSVSLMIVNNSDEQGIARISVVGMDGKTQFESDKLFPAKQSTGWIESLPVGSKLKWSYTLPTLGTAIDFPSRTIVDSGKATQDVIEIVSPLVRYNETDAVNTLKKIASELDLDKNPIQLKKAQEQMGNYWIGNSTGDKIGPGWHVLNVEISADGTIRFENSLSIEGKTMISASADIPLAAQMQANFESGQLYKVLWKAEHFTFSNSKMVEQLPVTPIPILMEIGAALSINELSSLCYVRQAKVLKYVAHSITKGTKVLYSASLSASTIFSADGSYIFNASDSSLSALTDQVVKMEYACIPGKATIDYIKKMVELKKASQATPL